MIENNNPFLQTYDTIHHTVPFHLIKTEHYEPAIKEGIEEHTREIEAIVNNPDEPTFDNTIVALEKAGSLLNNVTNVFGNMLSAETNDEMQAIAERMTPLLSEHYNNITLNEKLFARIKTLYTNIPAESLDNEQKMLLKKTYEGFIRSGANLDEKQKERFRQISSTMSMQTLHFSQNNLKPCGPRLRN